MLFPPLERQRAHYNLDERPTEPVEADWMLGGSLLLRRAMLDELGGYDAGFRMYGEEIDLCYRAAQAGLGALVRARRRSSATAGTRLTDERVPHPADALALALGAALRAQAPRDAASAAEAEDPLGQEGLADAIRAGALA